jgi:hypothetical protein
MRIDMPGAVLIRRTLAWAVLGLAVSPSFAKGADAAFHGQFLRLCDVAVRHLSDPNSKGAFFVDSYAVRALCAAYDMTGNKDYLDACRAWSDRMVDYQHRMIPTGAYYMHYNRRPGLTNADWYSADSSSIGMGVLATAERCQGTERRQLLNSAKEFADLVLRNYVTPSGGVSDGLWSKSTNAWWCSSSLFGSFSFVLYSDTGEASYLRAGLGAVDWLNRWDPEKPQPYPLSEQGPAMLMYVMECYSASWPYLAHDAARKHAAMEKVSWCLDWIARAQAKPLAQRPWVATKWWGTKFGGLPFHQYIFSRRLSADGSLVAAGDAEMRRLAAVAFKGEPTFSQLTAFMMMSYAERLDPGGIYRSNAIGKSSAGPTPANQPL